MSPVLTNKIDLLIDRASLFSKCRSFFAERGVIEVDVPILSREASVDTHIDLITATCCHKKSFLHSSPEYGMKKLLSQGMGDIYQLSHVFRDGEEGSRHLPEFTMVEWYRVNCSFRELIQETTEFIFLFLGELPVSFVTYEEVFKTYTGYSFMESPDRDHDLAFCIEPQLGKNELTILYDFPSDAAALAKVIEKEGKEVALRFEVFYQGIEIANGYDELLNAEEQRQRLLSANKKRREFGKEEYPIDHDFLEALERGMPACCGVAVGFDRLMMLRHDAKHIKDVVP